MATTGVSSMFSGNSRFAADFQQILDRSVSIASLPMQQLENQQAQIADEAAAVGSLEARFTTLQASLTQLQSSLSAYTSSLSSPAVAVAAVSSGAFAGAYELEVLSLGSYSSSLSSDGLATVTDPSAQSLSPSTSFTLTVAGQAYDIHPASNTLTALAEALNASGAGVEATIVNVGSSASPDYRLSVRATRLGDVSIQLNDGSQDLLDSMYAGALASYRIQGYQGDPVTSDSRTVTIAPGLSVTLLQAGSTTIQVERDLNSLTSAVSSFVSAYNDAVDELDKHRGEDAGALQGSSLVFTLASTLRGVAAYASDGSISTLTRMGVEFDQNGHLMLDSSLLQQAAREDWSGVAAFFGSPETSGFLKSATEALQSLSGSEDGILPLSRQSLATQTADLQQRIDAEQGRIDQLQQHLAERLAAADALIASLEQQAKYFTNLFETMMSSWSKYR